MFTFNKKINAFSAADTSTVSFSPSQLDRVFASAFLLREILRNRSYVLGRLHVMECEVTPEGTRVIDDRVCTPNLRGRISATVSKMFHDKGYRSAVVSQLAACGGVPICRVGKFECMPVPRGADLHIASLMNGCIATVTGKQRAHVLQVLFDEVFSSPKDFNTFGLSASSTAYQAFGEVTAAHFFDLLLSVVADVLLFLPREFKICDCSGRRVSAISYVFPNRKEAVSFLDSTIAACLDTFSYHQEFAYPLEEGCSTSVWHQAPGCDLPRNMWTELFMPFFMCKLPMDVSAQLIHLAFNRTTTRA